MLRTTSRYLQPTLLHYGTFHRQTRFIYSTCCRLAAGGSRSDHHRVPIYSTCCRLAAGLSIEPSLWSTDLLFAFCSRPEPPPTSHFLDLLRAPPAVRAAPGTSAHPYGRFFLGVRTTPQIAFSSRLHVSTSTRTPESRRRRHPF